MNISASGVKIRYIASRTAPTGFDITQFTDDTDAFVSEDVQISETAAALNGDMVDWSVPNVIPFNISVLPNTDEQKNLDKVWNANRVSKNKLSVHDVITIIITYPDGTQRTLANGVMTNGSTMPTATSGGRLGSMTYSHSFQDVI